MKPREVLRADGAADFCFRGAERKAAAGGGGGGGMLQPEESLRQSRKALNEIPTGSRAPSGAEDKLTMLTSDTMSMLAMSMLIPTSTGAPVET